MGKRKRSLRNRTIRFLAPFVLVFFASYTIYQLFSGERGLFTWLDLREQVNGLKQQNRALEEQKTLLEDKTRRLSPATLDEDFLDEQVRRNLPYLKPGDQVIFLPVEKKIQKSKKGIISYE
ncbi:MAG: septum formation initiator family protein [Alphaproteobacteria bacterium]|nr:septum formation initiator family protein [Alphaproteobacteria bacterium]MDD9920096.1 septum formation initiator family protein [Alphaproteobacteria bacterium]